MKKFLLLFALVALVSSVEAQNRFRFGLQGTLGSSWMSPDTKGIEGDGIRLNNSYGIMLDYDFLDNGNYWLSTGVNLGQLNGKLKYPDHILLLPTDTVGFLGTTSTKYTLNYVEIPINLKMRTNEVGYMHYFGEFGIGLGINTRARADFATDYSGGNFANPENPVDVADNIRLFRLGLNIGLGAEYNLTGNTYAVAALRYHNGFTNLFNDNYYELSDTNPNEVKLENGAPVEGPKWNASGNALMLSVGVFF